MGITAQNPNYEDTKSSAHTTVLMTSMMLVQFTLIGPLFAAIFLDIGLGFSLFRFMESVFGIDGFMAVEMLMGPAILLLVGGLMLYLGTRSLGKVEV
jgi:predicted membrane protein